MELTTPTPQQLQQWDADWAGRPGYIAPDQRGRLTVLQAFAVLDDNRFVGMVAVLNGNANFPSDWGVADVWIAPRYRRQGLARAALGAAEQWCRQQRGRLLRVAVNVTEPSHTALFDAFTPTARHMTLPVPAAAPPLPDDIAITELPADEYGEWLERGIADFARQSADSNCIPITEALTQSRQIYRSMLPQGMDTPQHEFLQLRVAGDRVAGLWLQHNPARPETFVCKVETDSRYRRKGYGRAAMRLAEQRAVLHRMPRIRLNVFARNETANRLYRSLGYHVDTEFRVKRLDG
jgi:ribosomal protein S18 acetylase RimI-like enzyme